MADRSNQRVAYFNGAYVPEARVLVPFRDRSFIYGDGCFDMTRTFDGRPFKGEGAHRPLLPLARATAYRHRHQRRRHDRNHATRWCERNSPPAPQGRRLLGRAARVARRPVP